jgi:hypothetical protein
MLRRPPYATLTALSKTSWDARQMSGPVPSPSINGIIGVAGTRSLPAAIVIASPRAGGSLTSLRDRGKADMMHVLGFEITGFVAESDQ